MMDDSDLSDIEEENSLSSFSSNALPKQNTNDLTSNASTDVSHSKSKMNPLHIETGASMSQQEEDENNEDDHLSTPLIVSPASEYEIESGIRKRTSSLDASKRVSVRSPNHFYNKRKERMKECFTRALELQRKMWRNTITLMNFLAKVLFWVSLIAMSAGILYFTRELAINGKEPHLIAWFSAGGFVILGFPISIYGILMHLTNYYQPNTQCYVVRILWMVPIYSIESWLCLRFHEVAIYIETLRDCYESFVLYCFLQFLIEVLGGEEALIMLLKDKSPTRGIHIWGFDWCIKPWVMGQPISVIDEETGKRQVKWTSPFFKNCKLGCLQYVLCKLVCSLCVMILEKFGLYKEGDFSYSSGYLYICILTNTSQCWALYCLVFFYYATKNELGPIRPVGKFLSVKALVFFTWWQSVGIAFLHQMDLIPAYIEGGWSSEEVAKGIQAYLICVEMFAAAIVHTFVFPHTDYMRPIVTSKTPVGAANFGRRVRVGRRLGRYRNSMGHLVGKDDRSACSKTSDAPSMFDVESHSANSSGHGIEIVDETGTLHPHADTIAELDTDITGKKHKRKGFVNALIDSAVPRDVMENTVGIARGDFTVEKKTLLYHAAASDEYSLFAKRRAMMGREVSEATRQKIGDKLTGREVSEATRENSRGRIVPEATRQKISDKLTGREVSETTREKISKTLTGREVSEATRKKISDAKRGTIMSEATREKISDTKRGTIMSEATRKKMGDAKRGKKLTKAHKKNISAAMKRTKKQPRRK